MLANAVRLCEAKFGTLYLYEGGGAFRMVATHNMPPAYASARRRGPHQPHPDTPRARVINTKQPAQIADLAATQGYAERNLRSEERRVGKECRTSWSMYH